MGRSQGSPQMWKVEMGAAYSVLNNFSGPLPSDSCQVVGISGKPSIRRFTLPLCYLWDLFPSILGDVRMPYPAFREEHPQ